MDSIGSFFKEFKNHLTNKAESELEDAFTETKTSLYKSIQEFYDISGCPFVLYEPCVHIKDLQFLQCEKKKTFYNCSDKYVTHRNTLIESKRGIYTNIKLPKDEYIIKIKTKYKELQEQSEIRWRHYNFSFIFTTNYGRVFNSLSNIRKVDGGEIYELFWTIQDNCVKRWCSPYGNDWMKTLPIERLDPLPYKIPSWFFEAYTALESRDITTLQAINKNFFLFAGKWSHYITENIEFDVEEIEKELLELKEKNRLQAVEIKTLTDMVKKSKNKNSTSYECPICIEIKSNVVFNCGHIICNDCQIPLDLCPICREQITKRIKIFI
jgi:hypothetical protein